MYSYPSYYLVICQYFIGYLPYFSSHRLRLWEMELQSFQVKWIAILEDTYLKSDILIYSLITCDMSLIDLLSLLPYNDCCCSHTCEKIHIFFYSYIYVHIHIYQLFMRKGYYLTENFTYPFATLTIFNRKIWHRIKTEFRCDVNMSISSGRS